jgi:preprotein translocase subunit SecG
MVDYNLGCVRVTVGSACHSLLRVNSIRLLRKGFTFVMTFLLWFLVVLHVIISLFLVGVVLLQTGKSADLAGAFGGQGSQTAFGPRGAANLLTKLTAYGAVFFMLTSVGLTIVLSHTSGAAASVLSGSATAGKK